MANDLYFLVFFFELVLFLNFIFLTRGLAGEKRPAAILQQLKSNLPLTAILLTGVLLLSTAADSMNLGSIQNYLETSELSQASLLNDYSAMLGLILIVSGAVFRVGLLPFHFQNRLLLKETTCLQAIMAMSVLRDSC